MISHDHELAKTFDYFYFLKNALGNLDIKKNVNSPEVNRTSLHDPVDKESKLLYPMG